MTVASGISTAGVPPLLHDFLRSAFWSSAKTRIFGNEGRLVPPGNQWRSVPNLPVFGNEGSLVPPGNQRRSVPNSLANRDNALLSKRRIPAV